MKKLLKTTILLVTVFSFALFTSCEPKEEPCEAGNYGTVKVNNMTGSNIYVDVTFDETDYNDERFIYNNGSSTYSKIPAGSVDLWASFNGDDWVYNTEYLSACETLDYNWNVYKSATMEDVITLEVLRNGVVIDAISNIEKINK